MFLLDEEEKIKITLRNVYKKKGDLIGLLFTFKSFYLPFGSTFEIKDTFSMGSEALE